MDNIKTDLKGTAYKDVDWIRLPWDIVQWDGVLNTIMIIQDPENIEFIDQ
jgi:hypothetical protein